MNIGFIGLGQMGKHMALNLHKGGANVRVFDANREAVELLVAKGVSAASGAKELTLWADAIFLSLPNADIVERVVFGEGGIARDAREGLILVDLGTSAYMKTVEFGKRLKEMGIRFADAPVSGMESRAEAGELTLMYGGAEDAFEAMRPYFAMFSNCIVPLGDVGAGQLGKLVNQLLFDINVTALAEILALSAKLGLDPEKTIQVATTGTGSSWASEFFAHRMAAGNFGDGYSMDNAYKDLISASEISANLRIPMPILHAATSIYQMSLCSGLGGEDKGAMIKVYEQFLGVQFRK